MITEFNSEKQVHEYADEESFGSGGLWAIYVTMTLFLATGSFEIAAGSGVLIGACKGFFSYTATVEYIGLGWTTADFSRDAWTAGIINFFLLLCPLFFYQQEGAALSGFGWRYDMFIAVVVVCILSTPLARMRMQLHRPVATMLQIH